MHEERTAGFGIVDEVRANGIRRRSGKAPVNTSIDEVALDGLEQVLRLARTIEDTEAATNDSLSAAGE